MFHHPLTTLRHSQPVTQSFPLNFFYLFFYFQWHSQTHLLPVPSVGRVTCCFTSPASLPFFKATTSPFSACLHSLSLLRLLSLSQHICCSSPLILLFCVCPLLSYLNRLFLSACGDEPPPPHWWEDHWQQTAKLMCLSSALTCLHHSSPDCLLHLVLSAALAPEHSATCSNAFSSLVLLYGRNWMPAQQNVITQRIPLSEVRASNNNLNESQFFDM